MNTLKQYLKGMAEIQRKLKGDRKTGSCPNFEERKRSNKVALQVFFNKLRITAALNLYHQIRQTGFDGHNVDPNYTWYYDKAMNELKKEFCQPAN